METVLKFDRVILVKEFNDKFKKVGESYEVAVIREDSFLLRETSTKIAIGVISFEDFERCFVKEEDFKGWTNWTELNGENGRTDVFYRTNKKRVQVKFLTDKVKAEASCHHMNDFNLFFGIQLAYLRCENKALLKREEKYTKELSRIYSDMTDNKTMMRKMINALEV